MADKNTSMGMSGLRTRDMGGYHVLRVYNENEAEAEGESTIADGADVTQGAIADAAAAAGGTGTISAKLRKLTADLALVLESVNGVEGLLAAATPAGTNNIGDVDIVTMPAVALQADARTTALSGGIWTLGSTSIVESINVPDWARGFRLRPSADTRFAVGEDPVASGAETLTVGNTAYANETEVRLLEAGAGRTLRLLTTGAGSTCGVGFF